MLIKKVRGFCGGNMLWDNFASAIMGNPNTIETNDHNQKTLDFLKGELSTNNERKERARQELLACEDYERELLQLISGLTRIVKRPMAVEPFKTQFFTINYPRIQEIDIPIHKAEIPAGGKYGVQWKKQAKVILTGHIGIKLSTSELFDKIHPKAFNLSKEERRKAMVNLSIALGEMAERGEIVMAKNESGKGNVYWIE